MKLLSRLERTLGRLAVPHLTLVIVGGQVIVYVLAMSHPEMLDRIQYIPQRVADGEVWRLFTFIFIPGSLHPIWLFFGLYLFYLFGGALENAWGEFRYNLFLFIGWLATIAAAWIQPDQAATNGFLAGSVFLAFAWLFPDFVLYIMFILPVKVKWMAVATWLFYAYIIAVGDGLTRMLVLASVANFLLFFGREILRRAWKNRARMDLNARKITASTEPFHRCLVCGKTDRSHPDLDFRYCPDCIGSCGYCPEHIHNHQHRA